ncbi:putative defensin-like protein 62 [Capsella rubella]|uniref:putative defensin-like protein 62 n=1 Tax=Capsella rubella TaxID=81985 RepID=UPI000CD53B5F|nr:putative defensin-like protein 62 [Capsella rubella]
MDITKRFVTIFLVVILTVSVIAANQQTLHCIEKCSQFYGNLKCYKDCRNQHYDGGQCDDASKGQKLPQPKCCCYNYSN